MGRRKLPIEFIKNDKSRKETFKKRMKGLKGKAEQLATLCNAQVGVVVICDEKIHEAGYGSNTSSFRDIIYKYARFNFELNQFQNLQKMLNPDHNGGGGGGTNNTNTNVGGAGAGAGAGGAGGLPGGVSCLDLNLPSSFFTLRPNGSPGMMSMEGIPYNGFLIPPSMVKHQQQQEEQMQEDDNLSNSSIGDQKSMVSSVDKKDSDDSKHQNSACKVFHQQQQDGKLFHHEQQQQQQQTKHFAVFNNNNNNNHHHHHGMSNTVSQCCNLDIEPLASQYPATTTTTTTVAFHQNGGGGGEFGSMNMFGAQEKSLVTINGNTFHSFSNFNSDSNNNMTTTNTGVAFVDDTSRGINIFPYDPAFQFNHLESALDMDFEKSLPMQSFHWADEPVNNNNNNATTPTTSNSS